MASIDTLVDDIYGLFEKDFNPSDKDLEEFGKNMAKMISTRVGERKTGEGTLRMSALGQPCSRKLYYSVNHAGEGEPLTPQTRFKFLYGDILEEVILFLAKQAGHDVQGEQEEVEVGGILGHRDAVIDGRLVDVKSASSFGFKKFAEHKLLEDDPFGYIKQAEGYLEAAQDDPLVTDKDKFSFLVIEKQMGKITLDTYDKTELDYREFVEDRKRMVSRPLPPPRGFSDEPDGKSGNRKLGTVCSYCDYKHKCWPSLRLFAYAGGPRFLTEVENLPKVPEVRKE